MYVLVLPSPAASSDALPEPAALLKKSQRGLAFSLPMGPISAHDTVWKKSLCQGVTYNNPGVLLLTLA